MKYAPFLKHILVRVVINGNFRLSTAKSFEGAISHSFLHISDSLHPKRECVIDFYLWDKLVWFQGLLSSLVTYLRLIKNLEKITLLLKTNYIK